MTISEIKLIIKENQKLPKIEIIKVPIILPINWPINDW